MVVRVRPNHHGTRSPAFLPAPGGASASGYRIRLQITMALTAIILLGPGCGGPHLSENQPAGQEHPEVRAFLNAYFRAWTEADFTAYGAFFSPRAVIHFRDRSGQLKRYEVDVFVEGQARKHRRGDGKSEEPISMRIEMENECARCLVRWKLTRPDGIETGYNHYLLTRAGDSWQIVSLLFYFE